MTSGPIFIMIAAAFWAIDALIRTPLTLHLSPLSIVFWEHVIGLFVISPFVLSSIKRLRQLTVRSVLWFGLLALVSSIGGTLFFTQALATSFESGDFVTPLLIQKLQPLIVITLSFLLLKEKIRPGFWKYAPLALIGGYLMSFGFQLPQLRLEGHELVILLSLLAATCWATGTIISKTVLKSFSVTDSTFIRFAFAIPLTIFVGGLGFGQIQLVTNSGDWLRFILIAMTTGAAALAIYYVGLRKTPAHVATIAELIFPLVSILIGITSLNPYGSAQTLTFPQIIGIFLLLFGVIKTVRS